MCNRLDGEANNGIRSVDALSSYLACHFICCLFCLTEIDSNLIAGPWIAPRALGPC